MGYVEKVLQPEESVIYKTTLHWFVYLQAIAWAVLTVIAFVVSFRYETTGGSVMRWITLGLLAMTVLTGAVAYIHRATTELAVTSRRIIFKTGLLKRRTFEMNRSTVESVGVEQTVLGRLLGYGRVELKGTGATSEPLPLIHDPLRFRSHITAS
jgi:uncharacterized membrane protein YdbT with pleckstrin-like domain